MDLCFFSFSEDLEKGLVSLEAVAYKCKGFCCGGGLFFFSQSWNVLCLENKGQLFLMGEKFSASIKTKKRNQFVF